MRSLRVLGSWDTVGEDHRNRASHRVRGVLAGREDAVERVVVRLGSFFREGDVREGDVSGEGDVPAPECRVLVRRRDGQTLRAKARGRTYEEAIDRAARRLKVVWAEADSRAAVQPGAWEPARGTT